MTNQPNIKLEILRYVRDSEDNAVSLRDFAEERGYEEHRVANKVNELSPLLGWGVSPMVPWINPRQEDAVDEQIEEYEKHE